MIHETSFLDALEGKSDPYPEVTRATRLVQHLREISSWNDFAASLVQQHDRKGTLSDKQMDAAERMLVKIEANRAAKEPSREQASSLDLSAIEEMFAEAARAGKTKIAYRAEGLRISPSRNGGLMVKNETRFETGHYGARPLYVGSIHDGQFLPGRAADQSIDFDAYPSPHEREQEGFTPEGWVDSFTEGREPGTYEVFDTYVGVCQRPLQALALIASNPNRAATMHGQRTGRCSCCGRELTNPDSIALGIGPICKDRWGF
jgi:hypothetical protein